MSDEGHEYRRGWRALVASAVGSGVGAAPVTAYSLGALVGPLGHAFGWSRSQVGSAALVQSVGVLIAGAAAGGLADRFGARRVALMSLAALSVSLAALTLMTRQIWTLYAGYFAVAVLGAGTLPMIWGRAVVGWFKRNRGVALGLSLLGTGLVGALLPSYVTALAAWRGWQAAYLGLAALPLFLGLPVAAGLFRELPTASAAAGVELARSGSSFRQALGTLCFWQMSVAFTAVAFAVSGVLIHALPLLTDRGVDRKTAAAVAGLFGLAVITGRLVSGYCMDLFRSPWVGAALFIVPALAALGLRAAGGDLLLLSACVLCFGLAAGAESDVAAYLIAKYFGRLSYGAIYGLLYTLFGLGSGLGPMVVGAVYDRTGSYDAALSGAVAVFLAAALLIGTLRPPRALEEARSRSPNTAQESAW